ncbi:hypothetical protein [Fusobacterium sp. PH5-44]|uniref:hypothetical protein n=1 Tax=unclassified Fusobacterium TaxID=2648384 RepID=UPI003D19E0E1
MDRMPLRQRTKRAAVGVLTGKIVYDQKKGIILSDELAAKVEQDTVQYFNDKAAGKLGMLFIRELEI